MIRRSAERLLFTFKFSNKSCRIKEKEGIYMPSTKGIIHATFSDKKIEERRKALLEQMKEDEDKAFMEQFHEAQSRMKDTIKEIFQ